ncbi:hypothetical protein BT96DRAFT_923941 [Gymnopus androsaceus JB14]|uniref:F-box domain-containing protein n=1 Tax=Gymnopus androsaceus JB14 TaxID=1447944 RepID=A0A6A4H781_9AGAR|nr:hypothetical protein BT96DRAFT_923941 [Gymnopus androsaceus JB14]
MRRSLRLRDKSKDIQSASAGPSTEDRKRRRSEELDDAEEEPSRTSVKKKAKKSRSDEDEEPAAAVALSKEKKKMPREFRKVRGNAPLDIFFEIFMHLDPGDLLRLARTSKNLRNVLMSKSSESAWRAARSNVDHGLPPLPDDLSEPQYAHLVFSDSYCHNCLRQRKCEKVLWVLQMRCCKTCASHLLTTLDKVKESLNVDDRLADVIPYVFVAGHEIDKRPHYMSYRMVSVSTARNYKAEFDGLKSDEEEIAWLDRMKKIQRMQMQYEVLYRDWECKKKRARDQELAVIRGQRKADILNRLGELGWREEAEIIIHPRGYDNFSWHKLVHQSKKLTDRVWNNTVQRELVQMLTKHKTNRLSYGGCPCCKDSVR